MKIKIFFVSAALVLTAISLKAQKAKSFAILRGGLNLANISITNDGDVDDNKTLTSFQVGILGDFHIASFFSIQPGLLFTGKGSKTQFGTEGQNGYSKATTNPYYLEIPVNLIFKTPTGPVKFFAGAGPYLGIGIAGKTKIEGQNIVGTYNFEQKIEWSDDDPTTLDYEEGAGYGILKRFDYGLNGTAGLETKGLVISANYGLGLAKLRSGTNSGDDDNNKHRVFSITVGFHL